jgi:hypothetical protein
MRVKFVTAVALSAWTFAATSAGAGNWGKPGLWKMSTMMDMKMPGMPQLTPTQLAQMKKMGIKMPMMGEPVETQVCVTPQDAANFSMQTASASEKSGCKQSNFVHSGNRLSVDVVCNGAMNGRGHSDTVLVSASRYTSVFQFKGVSHGQSTDMKINTDAHWLGANCGNVKPLAPPTHHG